MEIKETKVYKFSELSPASKQKAIENNCNINVDYDWWDCDYNSFIEELETIGLWCEKFYFLIDRGEYIEPVNLKVIDERLFLKACKIDLRTKEARKILEETGFSISESKYNTTIETEDNTYSSVIQNKLSGFLTNLKESYCYLTGEESITEMLIVNEYDFTEDGTRF